jgi:hypothetical protein
MLLRTKDSQENAKYISTGSEDRFPRRDLLPPWLFINDETVLNPEKARLLENSEANRQPAPGGHQECADAK